MAVKTETHRDWENLYQDLSRLKNIMVVETETNQDWAKDVETETLSRVSLITAIDLISITRLAFLISLT